MALLSQIYAVRVITPEAYGRYSAVLAVVLIVSATFVVRTGELATLHLGSDWVAGQFSSARAKAGRILRMDFQVNLAVFLIMLAVGYLLSRAGYHLGYFIGLSLLIPVQTGYGSFKALFTITGRLKEQSRFETAYALFQSLLTVALVAVVDVAGLIAAMVIAQLVKTLLAYRLTLGFWPQPLTNRDGAPPSSELGNVWRFGSLSVGVNLLENLASKLDLVILGLFRSPADLAVYKVARSLSALPGQAFVSVWGAVRPRLLTAWHQGDYRRVLFVIGVPAALILAIMVLVLWPAWLILPGLLRWVYGPEYSAAALPLVILLVGTWAFDGTTSWLRFWAVITDKMGLRTAVLAVICSLMLVGGFLAGPHRIEWTAAVVAIASVAGSATAWAAFLALLRQKGRRPEGESTARHHID